MWFLEAPRPPRIALDPTHGPLTSRMGLVKPVLMAQWLFRDRHAGLGACLMVEQWIRGLPVLVVLGLLLSGFAGSAGTVSPDWVPSQDELPLEERLVEAWGIEPLQVPVDGRSLDELVLAYDAYFDIKRDPSALDVLSVLPQDLEGVVRDLLAVLWFVQEVRDEQFQGIADAELLEHLHTEQVDPVALELIDGVDEDRMRAAAVTLAAAVDEALPVLKQYEGGVAGLASPSLVDVSGVALPVDPQTGLMPPLIDLAPVLVMDPLGVDNLFDKDAVLMIDLGGDDVYDANAGGAMIHRGLVGDPNSCQDHIAGFSIGCENEDSFESFTASLLIDVAGDDTYGVYKPPRPGSRDAICGPHEIIRRVVTYGSGSGGVGMLVDVQGNDEYHGKTLSMGNGHLSGVGVFFDLGGDDHFQAVRSSMGSSILQGSGYFFSGGGDDSFVFQAPAGGLWNVDRGRCDHTNRLGLGAAVIQGHATFVNLAGDDTYVVSSQAFGHVEATGVAQFFDLGGVDDYGGYPGRDNNMVEVGEATFVDQD